MTSCWWKTCHQIVPKMWQTQKIWRQYLKREFIKLRATKLSKRRLLLLPPLPTHNPKNQLAIRTTMCPQTITMQRVKFRKSWQWTKNLGRPSVNIMRLRGAILNSIWKIRWRPTLWPLEIVTLLFEVREKMKKSRLTTTLFLQRGTYTSHFLTMYLRWVLRWG